MPHARRSDGDLQSQPSSPTSVIVRETVALLGQRLGLAGAKQPDCGTDDRPATLAT